MTDDEGVVPTPMNIHEELRAVVERWAAESGVSEPGWFVGEWVLVGTSQNPAVSDATQFWHTFPNRHQPVHITLGLLAVAQNELR